MHTSIRLPLFAAVPMLALVKLNGAPRPLPTCPPDWKVEVIADVPRTLHPSVVCVIPDGRVPPMPEGLQVGLSLQEFSHLVSYVESLKDNPEMKEGARR